MTTESTGHAIENLLQTADLERARAGYLNSIAGLLEHTQRLLARCPVVPGLDVFEVNRADWHIERAKSLLLEAVDQARAGAIVDMRIAEQLQAEASESGADEDIPV